MSVAQARSSASSEASAAQSEPNAIGRRGADQRRAAHLHGLDRAGGVVEGREPTSRKTMRQLRLVDDADACAVAARPRWCAFACRRFSWLRDNVVSARRKARGAYCPRPRSSKIRQETRHETCHAIDYEVEYDNRARVPEHPEIFARWQRDAAAYRAGRAQRQARPWPTAHRCGRPSTCFRPRTMTRRRSRCSFTAAGGARSSRRCFRRWRPARMRAASRSRSRATIFARTCSIADIIEQMRAACLFLWRKRRQRICVYGHSAGGHLAACMVATDWKAFASDAPADLVPGRLRDFRRVRSRAAGARVAKSGPAAR